MGYKKHEWMTKEIIRREYLQNMEDGIYNEEQRAIQAEAQKVGKTDYATTEVAGVVKADGNTIGVDENGTISVIGGSGHTIIDADGNEMTKRDNLQFVDSILEDNAVGNKTIVRSNTFVGNSGSWLSLSDEEKAKYNVVIFTDDYEPTDLMMVGATSVTNGKSGVVPAPQAGDQGKFLKGDGTWSIVSVPTDDTPTQGSTNYVTSGGIYSYIDTMITQALSASY